MTLKVRICPCSVQFSLFDELCFTSWTAKLRLQVPIPKEPQSVQLLERDQHVVLKLEQMPLAFLVISFLPGRIFWTSSYSCFFSVLTFGLPGGLVQITMHHLKRLLILLAGVVLSARCHQEGFWIKWIQKASNSYPLVTTTECWY